MTRKLLFLLGMVATIGLLVPGAFAMNDGKQGNPCEKLTDTDDRITCRLQMLDIRLASVNEQGCGSWTDTSDECLKIKSVLEEQKLNIADIKEEINKLDDFTKKSDKRDHVEDNIDPLIHTMHENCDCMEDIRQGNQNSCFP